MSERVRSDDEKLQRPLYPQERTFVLRFDRTTDLGAGTFRGKLEEVASSGRHHFASLAELLEHLGKLID